MDAGLKADLHLHTHFSDGTESPADVVEKAVSKGFGVIAVTDHDTVAGVPEAMEAGKKKGVRVIPGVEITARLDQQELHLLAYFSDESGDGEGWRHPQLLKHLDESAGHRFRRAQKMVNRLNSLGVAITLEDVKQAAGWGNQTEGEGERTLGRPHVAAAMVKKGHVSSVDEAFSRFLKKGSPAWVDKERTTAKEVIDLVHSSGGLVGLAHPGLLRDEKIPHRLWKEKMDAVEVYHSRHTPVQSTRFCHWAREHDLLITGGSDCHGNLKGEPLMGRIEFKGKDLELFLARLGNG